MQTSVRRRVLVAQAAFYAEMPTWEEWSAMDDEKRSALVARKTADGMALRQAERTEAAWRAAQNPALRRRPR